MKLKIIIYSVVIGVCITPDILGISIVYNPRIATVTTGRQRIYERLGVYLPSIAVGTLVNQKRIQRPDIPEELRGGLVSYIYSFQSFYVRVDSAVGSVAEKIADCWLSHTQVDDVLFSTGYRHTIGPKLNIAYSALIGIPVHKDYGLEFFQLGTGHVGAGLQVDTIYAFSSEETQMLAAMARFVHFFSTTAPVVIAEKKTCVDLSIGNIVDILIAYSHRFRKRHYVELGYNPEFAFDIASCPSLGSALPSMGIRSTWFADYKFIFVPHKHPMGILLGLSYGFDHRPTTIGLKRIVTWWASWGINF